MAPISPPTNTGIGRSAKIVASARGRAVIHLTYDGTEPPEHLLGALRREGWRNATPSPPPAAAIDWSRADLASGRSYSVLPYPAVTAAVFEGEPHVRDQAVERARTLLIDAGLLHADGGPLQDPVLPTAGPAPQPSRRVEAPRAVPFERSEPRPQPAAGADGPVGPVVRVEVVVDESHAIAVRAGLTRHGQVLDEREDAVFTEVTFRGNRSEVMTSVRRMTAEVPAAHWNDVEAQLTSHRVLEINHR